MLTTGWWLRNLGAWTFVAIVLLLQSYLRTDVPYTDTAFWRIELIDQLIYCAWWALLTPAVLWLSKKWRLEKGKLFSRAVAHIAGGLVFAGIQQFLHANALKFVIRDVAFSPANHSHQILYSLDYGFLIYLLLVTMEHVLEYQKRVHDTQEDSDKLQKELQTATQEILKLQLHPHFLFNTLHSISSLIKVNPASAERMISRLGDFLRLVLKSSGSEMVPLKQELEMIESYLSIEQIRFQNRLLVRMSVESEVLNQPVPNLLLQPLVENAVHHGLREFSGVPEITITASQPGKRLLIEVSNNGSSLSDSNRTGTGLGNTRARLEQYFGENFRLELQDRPQGGVNAIVELPIPENTTTTEEIITA